MFTEPLAAGIDAVAGLAGAHGVETGLVATGVLLVWRGHRILSAIQSVLRTVRIGFVSAALVGLLVLVALGAGWISVSALPSLPLLPLPV